MAKGRGKKGPKGKSRANSKGGRKNPSGKRKRPASIEQKKYLLLITGSVGTGKSSVAKELGALISHKVWNVGKIVVERKKNLSSGYDAKRDSLITDVGKTKKFLLKNGALSKGNVVECHYSQELASSPDKVFVLRCEPKELDRRLLKRKYPDKKRAENIMAEILDSCLLESEEKFGKGRVVEVDTTGKRPKSVASEIALYLEKGVVPKRGKIDYMERYLGRGFDSQKLSFRLKP